MSEKNELFTISREEKEKEKEATDQLLKDYLSSTDKHKEPNDRIEGKGNVWEIILSGADKIPYEHFKEFRGV